MELDSPKPSIPPPDGFVTPEDAIDAVRWFSESARRSRGAPLQPWVGAWLHHPDLLVRVLSRSYCARVTGAEEDFPFADIGRVTVAMSRMFSGEEPDLRRLVVSEVYLFVVGTIARLRGDAVDRAAPAAWGLTCDFGDRFGWDATEVAGFRNVLRSARGVRGSALLSPTERSWIEQEGRRYLASTRDA